MPYLQNAMGFVIDTVVGLYLTALILRFLFQLLRMDFRNPLVQMMVVITNPPLRFMRKVIPGLYGVDLAMVVLILLVGLIKLTLPLLLAGYRFGWSGALVLSLADSLDTVVWIFLIAVLARVVVSWVAPRAHHPALSIIAHLSEPIMAPFRRILPPIAGLDFSPIATLMTLNLIQKLALTPLTDYGTRLFWLG